MKAEKRSVQYGAHVIGFSVVRRDRRTLEIAVEPDASIIVAVERPPFRPDTWGNHEGLG